MKSASLLRAALSAPWRRLLAMLALHVDGASLAAFRICFGLVMCWQMAEYLWPQHGTTEMRFLYLDTPWNFPYPGFEWLRPWPEPLLTTHFVLTGLAAACLAMGFCYRTAAVLFFLGYTYVFLLEQARYNNHYYLICLLAFLLIWMPAQRSFSVDAWRRLRRAASASNDEDVATIPFWPVLLLRAQLFLVYFYGGVAKIEADWLSGIPAQAAAIKLRDFLAPCLPQVVTADHLSLFLAWTGLAFDLAIGFLLLAHRMRFLALLLLVVFHGANHFLFSIGVFPMLAFTATLIFFPTDWPRRLGRWLVRPRLARPDWGWFIGGALTLPLVGAALGWRSISTEKPLGCTAARPQRVVVAFMVIWLAVQAMVPLRHFAIAGDANWTDEGHQFSWRMMLRAKSGLQLVYHVYDDHLERIDARGRSRFRWDLWSGRRAVFVPIDCQRFNWGGQGWNVICEPCLGERVMFVTNAASDEVLAERRKEVAAHFRKYVGREPEIEETVSLPETLRSLQVRFASLAENGGEDAPRAAYQACLQDIAAALELADAQGGPEKHWTDIVQRLRTVADSAAGCAARPYLRRIHPFALQGTAFPGHRFLLVEDPLCNEDQRDDTLRRLGFGNPYFVYVDMSRLYPDDWRTLPQTFVALEGPETKVVWNYCKELNVRQIDRFKVRPQMIHQYAQRIAKLWEADTGRRPKISVLSTVMLNSRRPQPLIDPRVDLARADYSFWAHNSWILPRPDYPRAASRGSQWR
jgi:hypothetical protein